MRKYCLKLGMLLLVTLVVAIQLTGCRNQTKNFQGYWEGTDEQGFEYSLEITKDKLKFLQEQQLTEHNYTIDEGEDSTQLYVDDENLSFTIVVSNDKQFDNFSMALSQGSNASFTMVNFDKIDKEASSITEIEKNNN